MSKIDATQVYNILQNLKNLEISYMAYSSEPHDYNEYRTYINYFNNHVLRSNNLYRFYFPVAMTSVNLPQHISDMGDITDALNIAAGYDFSICKLFNFPAPIRHKCNYYTLLYQMEGNATLTLDFATFQIKAGDFYLIAPQEYYAVETDIDSICIFFNLRRSFICSDYNCITLGQPQLTQFITDTLSTDSTSHFAIMHTHANNLINNLVLNIFAEYINREDYSHVTMRSLLSLLFATIYRDPNTVIESSAKVSRLDTQFNQIESYLKDNYQSATLSQLADDIHFSKQYICRIVKDKTGDTFNTLLIKIRLNMVVQYLLDTDLPLDEIAFLCGFSAASHMSRTFKNVYGISPSTYRKNQKTPPAS